MPAEHVHRRERIEAFLRRNVELHIYSLGDLDNLFWPCTTWYGWEEQGRLTDVVLIYTGHALPTVVGISEEPSLMAALLQDVIPLLPERFDAHLSPGLEEVFRASHTLDSHGGHLKMALRDRSLVTGMDCPLAMPLGQADLDEILNLYQESYPGNWFDPRMLETGPYFGIRDNGRLVSIAGVHVYSSRYRVAAIGNVVTHTACRNRGYGKAVTARLCQSLLQTTDAIGLNVKADNDAAIACYKKLGFELVAHYNEFTVETKG